MRPSKYWPLSSYLAALPPEVTHIRLSLAHIERLIGGPLPPSATDPRWWANRRDRRQSAAWRSVGWWVLKGGPGGRESSVTFVRLPLVAPSTPVAPDGAPIEGVRGEQS
jgi:hypothetical protein